MAKLSISNLGTTGPFKNKIINGGMNVWQRGVDLGTFTASSDFTADRFRQYVGGAGAISSYRSTGAPSPAQAGVYFPYSLRMNVTTADSSITATDYCLYRYKVEGYDIQSLMGKTCTLSFWVLSYFPGTYCIAFRNSDNGLTLVKEYTIDSSATWQFIEIPFEMHDGSSGTWDYINGIGLSIDWCWMGGTDFQTTADSWNSGLKLCTSNQTNAISTTDGQTRIVGVQLEEGSSATAFENKSITQELAMCQRYFQKSYRYETYPGQASSINEEGSIITALNSSTYGMYIYPKFMTIMRATPTITTYDSAGTAGKCYIYGSGIGQSTTIASPGDRGFRVNASSSVASVIRGMTFEWAADAEL